MRWTFTMRATWLSPAAFKPGDADADLGARILGNGKSSRMYRELVYRHSVVVRCTHWINLVCLTVAHIVDIDVVECSRIHLEIIRATARILKRLIIGYHRHKIGAAHLIASKHVEVGRIQFW